MSVSTDDIYNKINGKNGILSYKPVPLKQDIGRDTLAAIEVHKFDLPGVVVNVRPLRHYVKKGVSAHIIGYLSEINPTELKSGKYPESRPGDFIGKFGAEKAYGMFFSQLEQFPQPFRSFFLAKIQGKKSE